MYRKRKFGVVPTYTALNSHGPGLWIEEHRTEFHEYPDLCFLDGVYQILKIMLTFLFLNYTLFKNIKEYLKSLTPKAIYVSQLRNNFRSTLVEYMTMTMWRCNWHYMISKHNIEWNYYPHLHRRIILMYIG